MRTPTKCESSDKAYSRRECPICGGLDRRVLHRQEFFEGVLGDGYFVVVCEECGAGFADGIPSQAELDNYYARLSKYTYGASGGLESEFDFKRFEVIADHVQPYLESKESSILDVGSATGGLLSVFEKRGYRNVTGADPSPECSRIARELHRVDVRVATLSQLPDWREHYDLVLMIGVLEHIREAKAAIRDAAGRLNNGGLLYLAVPDIEAIEAQRNAPFQEFSMEHVNFFSRVSLVNLLGCSGLSVVESWRMVAEWSAGTKEPILSVLCSRGLPAPRMRDKLTEPALSSYIEAARGADKAIDLAIEALVHSQTPLLVWGAGALARRLLASTSLANANISAFVDSNPRLQGKELAGKKILAPRQLIGRGEDILICSVAFAREIETQIREQLRLANRVLRIS